MCPASAEYALAHPGRDACQTPGQYQSRYEVGGVHEMKSITERINL